MEKIKISDLVHMDGHNGLYVADVVYADAAHPDNVFGCALYRSGAQIYLHRRLADIVVKAAVAAKEDGLTLVVKDGLRPMEAQAAMGESPIAKLHPEWLVAPRLISPPGAGGHPRGMAVDVTLFDAKVGGALDMGTPFDCFPEHKDAGIWPAHRAYVDLPQICLDNRARLDRYMEGAAAVCAEKLLALPAEWWDYRFYPEESALYEPLSDLDLPDNMRLCINKACIS
tara:strand:- start:106135 stop:106815 length:681 start_codon:yes stop_codon:yes gene_type:complete